MKWRKWNRIIHRDVSYFFFGMVIIYALSGIALNHMRDWNPSYIISTEEKTANFDSTKTELTESEVLNILAMFDEQDNYKKHYYPGKNQCKVFLNGGSLVIDLKTGKLFLEKVTRRPIFFQANYLHYNPNEWWTVYSDIFCVSLILVAITGLFIIKGKNGLKWRGTILIVLGMIIPILFLL